MSTELADEVGQAPVVRVPFLKEDVHDLAGLRQRRPPPAQRQLVVSGHGPHPARERLRFGPRRARSALEDEARPRSAELPLLEETVRPEVEQDPPDLRHHRPQSGTWGAWRCCLDLHLEESGGRIPHVPSLWYFSTVGRTSSSPAVRLPGGVAGQTAGPDPDPARPPSSRPGGTVYDESYKPLPLAAASSPRPG